MRIGRRYAELADDLRAGLHDGLRTGTTLSGCPHCGRPLRPRVGTDVQAVAPVLDTLRSPLRAAYLRRVFTPGEVADSGLDLDAAPVVAAESLAARFAVKEAVVKVLRPGAGDAPRPPWTDIEVSREPGGWPRLLLHGVAARQAEAAGLTGWTCSFSHDDGLAVATVVAVDAAVHHHARAVSSRTRRARGGARVR